MRPLKMSFIAGKWARIRGDFVLARPKCEITEDIMRASSDERFIA